MKPLKFGRQSDIFACTAIGVYMATGTFRRVMVFALAYAITFLFINSAIFVINQMKGTHEV